MKKDNDDVERPTEHVDSRSLLRRLMHLESELGSIRHELVMGLGGPANALDRSDEFENGNIPSILALEIVGGSGTILASPDVLPSPTTVPVQNETGVPVTLSQGPVTPGVISISIPDGESRGIEKLPDQPLTTELVEYVWFEPICTPGTICIGQFHRYVTQKKVVDSTSADAIPTQIILQKRDAGGFGLIDSNLGTSLVPFRRIWFGQSEWEPTSEIQFMGWDGHLWKFEARGVKFSIIRYGLSDWIHNQDEILFLDWEGVQWKFRLNPIHRTFSLIKHGTLDWLDGNQVVRFLGWSGPGDNAWINRQCSIERG